MFCEGVQECLLDLLGPQIEMGLINYRVHMQCSLDKRALCGFFFQNSLFCLMSQFLDEDLIMAVGSLLFFHETCCVFPHEI